MSIKKKNREKGYFIDGNNDRFELVGEYVSEKEAKNHRERLKKLNYTSCTYLYLLAEWEKPWTVWKGRLKKDPSEGQQRRKERDGYINSPESRRRMSEAQLRRFSEKDENGKSIKATLYGKKGRNHPKWKGENISAYQMHRRVAEAKLKPEVCDICHQKEDGNGNIKLELSNLKNHEYTDNPDDYQYVHRSCHKKFDKK